MTIQNHVGRNMWRRNIKVFRINGNRDLSKRTFSMYSTDTHNDVAKPLSFASKSNSILLSPQQLKGTASILNPKWVHLSPCLGAALTTSPTIGNLLRIGRTLITPDNDTSLEKSAILANHVFFQMIRESTIHVTRTRSMPAAYLTPKMIGAILGQANCEEETIIKSHLQKEFGIKSNRINGDQWIGISLTRWLDLYHLSSKSHGPPNNHDCLPLTVWLTALWETSDSKLCLLDFLLEYDRHVLVHSQESIFHHETNSFIQALKEKDSNAIEEWNLQTFSQNEDLNVDNVSLCLDQLAFFYGQGDQNFTHHEDWNIFSNALETVCASIALHQVPPNGEKPSVPNGYFGYDGGDVKADCVEVTVREIMDLLLWDEESASFDLSRLPKTVLPELIEFYKNLPFDDDDYQVGKQWFDMMSDLKGCDYLATSPNGGRPYELAPTIDNVAKVCSRLLINDHDNPPLWTSLEEMAQAWKKPLLNVHTDTLIHLSGDKEEVVQHEIATLQLADNPNSIEIRMRCDGELGFSAVTHLRQPRKMIEQTHINAFKNILKENSGKLNPSLNLLALSLISDEGLLLNNKKQHDGSLLILDLLATPYGCDRRGVVTFFSNDGEKQSEMQRAFDLKEEQKSQNLLKTALYQICMLQHDDPKLCLALLVWILQESPKVIESSISSDSLEDTTVDTELELTILSLPVTILGNEVIHSLLWNNDWGMLRGRILSESARLKSNKANILEIVLGELTFGELFSLASLLYSKRRTNK